MVNLMFHDLEEKIEKGKYSNDHLYVEDRDESSMSIVHCLYVQRWRNIKKIGWFMAYIYFQASPFTLSRRNCNFESVGFYLPALS